MLKKILIVLLPLLGMCASQSTGLDNTQQLAPGFRLDWTVNSVSQDIIIQIQARAVGWLFLSIDNAAKTLTDAFKGGYNNTNGLGYVVVSTMYCSYINRIDVKFNMVGTIGYACFHRSSIRGIRCPDR